MNRQDTGRKGSSGNFRSGGRDSGSRGRDGGSRFGGRSGGGFRRDNFNSGPREMHKAICSDCKKECEVPFKPAEGKPVYCKECYSKHKKF